MNGKLIILLLVIMLLTSGLGLAAVDSLNLPWWTVDGGGAVPALSGGGLTLQGTTGQADAGRLNNDRFSLNGGYWNPFTGKPTLWVYLPVVIQ